MRPYCALAFYDRQISNAFFLSPGAYILISGIKFEKFCGQKSSFVIPPHIENSENRVKIEKSTLSEHFWKKQNVRIFEWQIQKDKSLALKTWSQQWFTLVGIHVGHPVVRTQKNSKLLQIWDSLWGFEVGLNGIVFPISTLPKCVYSFSIQVKLVTLYIHTTTQWPKMEK